jgi:hypothetical protein
MRRPEINISTAERVGRVALGGAGMAVGLFLLLQAQTTLAVVLVLLLILAGLDLVVTGGLGFCPLYKKLGHVPRDLRSAV